MAHATAKHSKKGASRRKRARRIRRIIGIVCLLLAAALGAAAYFARPRIAAIVWGAAALAAVVEAVILFRRRRAPVFAYALPGLLCVALIAAGPCFLNYVPFYGLGDLVRTDVTALQLTQDPPPAFSALTKLESLELRGAAVTKFDAIRECSNLKLLDARGVPAFTKADHDAIAAALPDCEILWDMQIAGSVYESTVTEIDLSAQCLSAQEILQLRTAYPEIRFTYNVDVCGTPVPCGAEELDLSETRFTDLNELSACLAALPQLRSVDLRGTPLSAEAVEALCSAYPGIEFKFAFAVPEGTMTGADTELAFHAGGDAEFAAYAAFLPHMPALQRIDLRGASISEGMLSKVVSLCPQAVMAADTAALNLGSDLSQKLDLLTHVEELDLRGVEITDFEPLKSCGRLKKLDVRGLYAFTKAEYDAVSAALPECEILWSMPVDGAYYDSDTTAIDLSDRVFTPQEILAIRAEHPQVDFTYRVQAYGMELSDATETLDLSSYTSFDIDELTACVGALPDLKELNLLGARFTEDEIRRILAVNPETKVAFVFSLFGVKVTTLDTEVNLEGHKASSFEDADRLLGYMRNLERINMCDCGLTDAQMAQLREHYPQVKFVWRVYFGKYALRTDADMFSTRLGGGNSYHYTSQTFLPLQYCTDLKFLDLGHNRITDISLLSGIKGLKVLILACNRITDIAPLAALEELEYIELFSNDIIDFSPLAGLQNLRDVNICRNRVKSIEPFLTCPSIQRLWVGGCGLSTNQLKQLKAALPNAEINNRAGDNPTTEGWRDHSHYYTIKKMYEKNRYIPWND